MVDPARRTGLLERTLGDISGCEISKADADYTLNSTNNTVIVVTQNRMPGSSIATKVALDLPGPFWHFIMADIRARWNLF